MKVLLTTFPISSTFVGRYANHIFICLRDETIMLRLEEFIASSNCDLEFTCVIPGDGCLQLLNLFIELDKGCAENIELLLVSCSFQH